jgi:hypothetical protein
MLRRILLVMSVAALMAAMMALTAVPAFATIHPLANSECSNENASAVAQTQDPPGLTPGPPDQSRANVAQPVVSVVSAQGPDSPAFKTSPDPNAPIQESCPAVRPS